MPEKFLQAVMITFLLNLVVGMRLSSFAPTALSQTGSLQAANSTKVVWQDRKLK
jgi:hypothetical protein